VLNWPGGATGATEDRAEENSDIRSRYWGWDWYPGEGAPFNGGLDDARLLVGSGVWLVAPRDKLGAVPIRLTSNNVNNVNFEFLME